LGVFVVHCCDLVGAEVADFFSHRCILLWFHT
jgi:hypothetical protein